MERVRSEPRRQKTNTFKMTRKENEAKTQREVSVAAPSSAGQGQIKSAPPPQPAPT